MSAEDTEKKAKKKKSSSSSSSKEKKVKSSKGESSKRKKPSASSQLKRECDAWLSSGVECAGLTLKRVDDNVLEFAFATPTDAFTVTAPSPDAGEHFFVFSEAPSMASWLMRISDFAERPSTKTLAQLLTKAAQVYVEEVRPSAASAAKPVVVPTNKKLAVSSTNDDDDGDDDDDDDNDDDNDDGDDDDGDDDVRVGAASQLADDADVDADFGLQSQDFQASLNLLTVQKKWAAKEAEVRRLAALDKVQSKLAEKAGDKKVATIFSASASSAVLTNDLLHILKHEQSLGFSVTPVDDNIYHWRVKLFNFAPTSRLARDLLELKEKHGYAYVELDVTYKMDLYPFFPPFVKLLRPRFHGFMMGAVASSGLFKLSLWDPVRPASQTITLLRDALQRDGAVDVGSTANDLVAFADGAYTPIEHALLRLQLLSEVPARASTLLDVGLENDKDSAKARGAAAASSSSAAAAGAGKEAWAKGTGYGYHGAGPAWDIENYLRAQAEKDLETLVVLRELELAVSKATSAYGDEDVREQLFQVVEGSCLVPFLEQHLSNESLLDMARHLSLYEQIVALVSAIIECPFLRPVLCRLVGQSPARAIMRLVDARAKQCRQLLKAIETGGGTGAAERHTPHGGKDDDTQLARIVVALHTQLQPHVAQLDAESRDNEAREARLAAASSSSSGGGGGAKSAAAAASDANNALEQKYVEQLRELQFDEHDIAGGDKYASFHYAEYVAGERQISRNKTLRAAQEQSALSTSLPLSLSSSVFARVDSSRIDTLRALITGPDDTPYSNGCFLFDIFLPNDWPNVPPLVNLQTTGNGTVRFNPNLYHCGKVCLSLLGTWQGDQGESWNPNTSTLLQVFVSIQSLILVPQPYFNEPSFEQSMHTAAGKQQSENYNQTIRLGTLQWAILGQLENPAPAFADVIKTHFRLKRDIVLRQCEQWTELADRSHKSRMQETSKKIAGALAKL
jgi:baculoviral IAP repeat-containing protein 6